MLSVRSRPVECRSIDEDDEAGILGVYALLADELGAGRVEDLDAFLGTVSRETDRAVAPHVVGAMRGGRLAGAVVGAYLREMNVGMVLYSAVRRPERGRGTYPALRSRLIEELNSDSRLEPARGSGPRSMDYLISEVERDGRLRREYVETRGAFVADCDYMQPAAQGLDARPLDLVLQPVGVRTAPSARRLEAIVREVYGHVYRLADLDRNAEFRHVVQSLRAAHGRS